MSFDERRVHTEGAAGIAEPQRRTKYTTDTIQPVASITKTLVGYLLADLVTRDRLSLDAPIDTYLPWKVRHPAYPETPITLRQLATHTSGLIDREDVYNLSYEKGDTPSITMREFVRRYTASDGIWFQRGNFGPDAPGRRYEYSNLGAALAAVAIEEIAREAFDAYARRMVLEPVGMKDSAFWPDVARKARRAVLVDAVGQPLAPYVGVTYADGGLRTTCRDMAKYAQAVLRARLGLPSALSPRAIALMLTPQFDERALPANFRRVNQGLFWQFNPKEGLGHSGGDPGVTAHLYLDPSAPMGYVLMANVSTEDNASAAEGVRQVWQALRAPRR